MEPKPAKPADGADRTLDVLHFERDSLRAIFAPKSVAVIGATEKEGSVGRTVLWNLISNPFGGTVYPINKQHNQVLGIKAYPNVASVPEPIDLAVIVTPAADGARHRQRVRRGRREKRDHHLGRIQGGGRRRRGTGTADRRAGARQDAPDRPELPGRDAPGDAPERDLCERDGAPRHGRLHQPERRAAYRRARLEFPRKRRLQRLRLRRLDARRRLGRPDQLISATIRTRTAS